MRPIKNQIVFKPFLMEEKTEGGLFVPESFKGESDKGEIVEVGVGTKARPMRLKKGDIGFRVHGWGTRIEKNGEIVYLMDENAIIALV